MIDNNKVCLYFRNKAILTRIRHGKVCVSSRILKDRIRVRTMCESITPFSTDVEKKYLSDDDLELLEMIKISKQQEEDDKPEFLVDEDFSMTCCEAIGWC